VWGVDFGGTSLLFEVLTSAQLLVLTMRKPTEVFSGSLTSGTGKLGTGVAEWLAVDLYLLVLTNLAAVAPVVEGLPHERGSVPLSRKPPELVRA
jgi:hypothetical protein